MPFERSTAWQSYNFKDLTGFLATRREDLKKVFDDNRKSDKEYTMTEEVILEVRSRNDELGDATKRWEELRQVDEIFLKNKQALLDLNRPVGQPPFPGQPADADARRPGSSVIKSLGQHLTDSQAYKAIKGAVGGYNRQFSIDLDEFEFKTTMTTAAGFAPANDRTNILIPFATRRPMLQDFIPTITTNLDAIKFMEETTFTNSSAGTAENAALPESAIAYNERSQPVEVIGTFLPITEQQMDIEESIRGTVDQRLLLMYTLKEESDLLSGNGSTPNLLGFLNKPSIQTQAKGSDPVPDCIYRLFTKLRGGSGSGFVEPTALVIHPNDWQDIRILRDSNGNYIWGSPADAGPERIWGKPLVVTTAITENTALTGDFQLFSQIWRKRGARVEAGMQNDDWVKLKMTLRVYGRLALVIYRAAAFGTATGI